MNWAQILTGLIGAIIGSGTTLVGQRWSTLAAKKRDEVSLDNELDRTARRNLVAKLRIVYEWVSVVESSMRALRYGISPAAHCGVDIKLEGVRRIVGDSQANDIMRSISGKHAKAAEDFELLSKVIDKCFKEVSTLTKMASLTDGKMVRYFTEEVGGIDESLTIMQELRRALKGNLIVIADSIGEDFLAERSDRWRTLAENWNVLLAPLNEA